ncbi:hypothetical protein TcBrA4_0008090 [Trypanosoma cruzi]|nr:hypothetical protein TcBrA4_0008090 [Trypanosoma cruzi]
MSLSREKVFAFDHAYDTDVPQSSLYEDLGLPVLDSSFKGFNTCIFAYGQTGSGKSYSMMGPSGGRDVFVDPGIYSTFVKRTLCHAAGTAGEESERS